MLTHICDVSLDNSTALTARNSSCRYIPDRHANTNTQTHTHNTHRLTQYTLAHSHRDTPVCVLRDSLPVRSFVFASWLYVLLFYLFSSSVFSAYVRLFSRVKACVVPTNKYLSMMMMMIVWACLHTGVTLPLSSHYFLLLLLLLPRRWLCWLVVQWSFATTLFMLFMSLLFITFTFCFVYYFYFVS